MKSILTARGRWYLVGAGLAAVILCIVLIRWGCADSRYGGTLRLASAMKPTLINPLLTEESISTMMVDLVFNGLMRLNDKGEMENDLVESWELSEDKQGYTFHLRQGVKFHDGVELTSEDVLFTYRELLKLSLEGYTGYIISMIEDIAAPDKYTFTIRLKERFSPFTYYLDTKILPAHLYKASSLADNLCNYKPVGSGPFRFQSWDEEDTITLTANDDYFEGRPYLDHIRIKRYPDREHIWTAFMRGELDMVFFLDREDYEIVAKDPAFQAYFVPSNRYYALALKLDDPILGDIEVRQALACAIDKDELIARTQSGQGERCDGIFHINSWAHKSGLKATDYNPERALHLLEAAGWRDQDKDGFYEKNGKPLVLTMLHDAATPSAMLIAKTLRQHFQQIGIKLLIDTQEVLKYPDDFKTMDSQMCLISLTNCIEPDCESRLWPLVNHCDLPESVFPSKRIRALFEKGREEFDLEKRKHIYEELEEVISDHQPVILLFYVVDYSSWAAQLVDVDKVASFYFPLYELKNVYQGERR